MISTKQSVDFALYHKKQLIRFCKKFHKDCYRLIGQKMALRDEVEELKKENGERLERLERAKRIIEELYEIVEDKVEYKSTIPMWNTMARAEKLLKEIEK